MKSNNTHCIDKHSNITPPLTNDDDEIHTWISFIFEYPMFGYSHVTYVICHTNHDMPYTHIHHMKIFFQKNTDFHQQQNQKIMIIGWWGSLNKRTNNKMKVFVLTRNTCHFVNDHDDDCNIFVFIIGCCFFMSEEEEEYSTTTVSWHILNRNDRFFTATITTMDIFIESINHQTEWMNEWMDTDDDYSRWLLLWQKFNKFWTIQK